MTFMQIVIGIGVLVGLALIWAAATKGVDGPGKITDLNDDGAPDATPHDKQSLLEMDRAEQKRRHPEG